jgi:hypothetical protein
LAAPQTEAAKHFAEGLRLYAEKDFDGAATELEASYKLNNDQTTLFAWAQAERLYGNCDEAKELLSTYVANGANAKQSKAAYDLMEQCTPRVVDPPVATEVVDPASNANTIGATGTGGDLSGSQADGGQHWYKDWVPLTLLGVGSVGVTLGLFSYGAARTDEKDAEKMGVTYDEYLQLRSDAEEKRTSAVIFGVGGGIILGAGVAYIFTDGFGSKRSKESPAEGMVMQLDGGGGSLSWAGQF